jgi:hypothetical protein
MAKTKNLLDEMADKLGLDETVECDNVLRWDGSKLYVEERVYRSGRKSRTDKRDVTLEVADRISRLK